VTWPRLRWTPAARRHDRRFRQRPGVLEDFRRLDVKIRQYVKGRQALMASDVIFTESLAKGATVAERLAGSPSQ
jgi:hypothetical protein